MKALVGYTGFVGSNIYMAGEFDAIYNSHNIENAYGTFPDLLIYAGVRAEKYLANNAPQKDMESIMQAEDNIAKIHPRKLVLISTIDVFSNPKEVDENSIVDTENLSAYGYNRYQLEKWVRTNYPDALIIRLPGLFGKNIKKNFLYDYINVIPFMIKAEKMEELSAQDQEIKKNFILQENGFYKLSISEKNREDLKSRFQALGFTALHFTDSRNVYQFYNLERLWQDIQTALKAEIKLWHAATEPVSAAEVYEYLEGKKFINELEGIPTEYGCKTIYADLFKHTGKYIADKKQVLEEIRYFVESEQ